MVKWTCSYFGLQHKPSTEANDILFKICNPGSADDERTLLFGMSKYVGQLHVHYSTGVDFPTQYKRRDLQPSVMDSERVHICNLLKVYDLRMVLINGILLILEQPGLGGKLQFVHGIKLNVTINSPFPQN